MDLNLFGLESSNKMSCFLRSYYCFLWFHMKVRYSRKGKINRNILIFIRYLKHYIFVIIYTAFSKFKNVLWSKFNCRANSSSCYMNNYIILFFSTKFKYCGVRIIFMILISCFYIIFLNRIILYTYLLFISNL